MRNLKHYKHLAFMGFWEVLKNLRTILANVSFCKKDILNFKPDALVLIDYPGFNMIIAKWATKLGIPVHYYILPQAWAWKENRVKKLAKHTNFRYVICLLKLIFLNKNTSLALTLLDTHSSMSCLHSRLGEDAFRSTVGYSNNQKVIALLPGSRKQEINKILQ
ncbi:MAG: hypothetical protein CM15mP83_3910 [Flavobacteriaceae bacterium]|nr:MAG: hypothetical protein CM15mP83_3910 [Flavobacteriaceae bacterium]